MRRSNAEATARPAIAVREFRGGIDCMQRVLVTGGRGFIGSHCLAPLLARGYEVHALSRQVHGDVENGVHWHAADLLDPVASAGVLDAVRPTHLLHLAWYVVPGRFFTADENYAWVTASLALVRRFAALGGTRVVAAGSSYEYDLSYGYCSEARTPIAPKTVYTACKHALHLMLEALAGTLPLSVAWPRIFFLYGPNEHPDRLVSYVVRSLLAGQPARCSHGRQIRDYLYVQDVADALVMVLDSGLEGPVNVASGVPVAVRDLVHAIGRMVGSDSLVQMGAIPGRANEPPIVVGSVERLAGTLAWQPRYSLEEGLGRTIEWWAARSVLTHGRVV